MMASVPKRRTSRTKKRQRFYGSESYSLSRFAKCTVCGNAVRPHFVCECSIKVNVSDKEAINNSNK